MTAKHLLRAAALLLLVALVLATVGPADWRPSIGLSSARERLLAFAVLGFVVALALPRRVLLGCSLVLGAAIFLEAAQVLTPGRHGDLDDLAFKLVGGAAGTLAGWLASRGLACLCRTFGRRPRMDDRA